MCKIRQRRAEGPRPLAVRKKKLPRGKIRAGEKATRPSLGAPARRVARKKRVWEITGDHSRSPQITRDQGRSQLITGDHSRSREITEDHGRSPTRGPVFSISFIAPLLVPAPMRVVSNLISHICVCAMSVSNIACQGLDVERRLMTYIRRKASRRRPKLTRKQDEHAAPAAATMQRNGHGHKRR